MLLQKVSMGEALATLLTLVGLLWDVICYLMASCLDVLVIIFSSLQAFFAY
jgi:hypothetical protein